jgi:hypothetical protein
MPFDLAGGQKHAYEDDDKWSDNEGSKGGQLSGGLPPSLRHENQGQSVTRAVRRDGKRHLRPNRLAPVGLLALHAIDQGVL